MTLQVYIFTFVSGEWLSCNQMLYMFVMLDMWNDKLTLTKFIFHLLYKESMLI